MSGGPRNKSLDSEIIHKSKKSVIYGCTYAILETFPEATLPVPC
jgi:hypothetical protein